MLARSCAGGTFPVLAPSELPFRERKIATLAPRGGFVSLVPTQLSDLLEGDQDLAPLAELRAILVGGAPSSASLLRRARQAGLPVVTTYGMTETAGGCVYDGLPLQGVSVCTEGGRIRLSGPMLAAGYLDEPTSPAFSTSGGKRWHVTNDAGVFDGHLKVLGRLDDVIISGGVKVFARQVEETLATFPGVRRVAVLPVEGGRWGQQVGAIVEADFRVADHAEELRSHVGAALGRTAAPRIFVQHSVPMLASGKVDRLAGQALLDEPDWVK